MLRRVVKRSDMSTEIVFETHSMIEDNERGVATGWLDGRLSPKGKQFARELGARRRHDHIAAVFTSDLGRAVETTEIALGGSSIPISRDASLRECNYGTLNGMPVKQLEVERLLHIDTPYPDGQSYRPVMNAVASFLNDVSSTLQGKRVLIIGHFATRWALDSLLDGVPLEKLVDAPFG